MTKEQFHSFVRLVRVMHNTQQESYSSNNSNSNLVAKSKALEGKVSGKLREFIATVPIFYEWQDRFIHVVKEVRSQQAMYYATKYESVLEKCREKEAILGKAIAYIETEAPQVFGEKVTQATLEL